MTDTASPGTSTPLDIRTGASGTASVFSVGATGYAYCTGVSAYGGANLTIYTKPANSGTPTGLTIYQTPALTNTGAKLLAVKNNTTEVAYIDKDGTVSQSGSIKAITAISVDTTLSSAHYHAEVTTAASTITITLPAATSHKGRCYIITKVDSGAGTVVVDGNASEPINGATTRTISAQWESVSIQCNAGGTGWIIT
jgi:hypothetical protein